MSLSAAPSLHSGLIVAGTQSSSGKTAVVSLLLAALQRHHPVQPFKVGPDYIDPGYHFASAGVRSINLDSWIMGEAEVRRAAEEFTQHAWGIVEGVMGLFDGANADNTEGSTFELACWLNWPVVLVVPCAHSGRSIGATVRGFLQEAGPERICGVILNGASSPGHVDYLRRACASWDIPLLGVLLKLPELDWPERHLGLQASTEQPLPTPQQLAELAEAYLDVEALRSWLRPLPAPPAAPNIVVQSRKRIALAQDEAFHFYYQANLAWLQVQGVEVVPFSPLHDEAPPEADGLILGGGFPEVFAKTMAANTPLLRTLAEFIRSGMPCYAECGGLMLLTESLETQDGNHFSMAGVIPGSVAMTNCLQNFGYCHAQTDDGLQVRGHEFHYSRWREEAEHANAWTVTRHSTGSSRREGFRSETLHASYIHLHFPQAHALLKRLFQL